MVLPMAFDPAAGLWRCRRSCWCPLRPPLAPRRVVRQWFYSEFFPLKRMIHSHATSRIDRHTAMKTLPSSLTQRTFSSIGLAAVIAMFSGTHSVASDTSNRFVSILPHAPKVDNGAKPVPRFGEIRLERIAPDTLLTGKGLVRAEFPWAVNMPNLASALVFGGSKEQMAQRLHAEKVRVRNVQRIHDMIDMVGLINPAQAKIYRSELQGALAAARWSGSNWMGYRSRAFSP